MKMVAYFFKMFLVLFPGTVPHCISNSSVSSMVFCVPGSFGKFVGFFLINLRVPSDSQFILEISLQCIYVLTDCTFIWDLRH